MWLIAQDDAELPDAFADSGFVPRSAASATDATSK
jgi:hypothetical protein